MFDGAEWLYIRGWEQFSTVSSGSFDGSPANQRLRAVSTSLFELRRPTESPGQLDRQTAAAPLSAQFSHFCRSFTAGARMCCDAQLSAEFHQQRPRHGGLTPRCG